MKYKDLDKKQKEIDKKVKNFKKSYPNFIKKYSSLKYSSMGLIIAIPLIIIVEIIFDALKIIPFSFDFLYIIIGFYIAISSLLLTYSSIIYSENNQLNEIKEDIYNTQLITKIYLANEYSACRDSEILEQLLNIEKKIEDINNKINNK